VFAVVCLCVCLSAVVAALVANKDIYKLVNGASTEYDLFKGCRLFAHLVI